MEYTTGCYIQADIIDDGDASDLYYDYHDDGNATTKPVDTQASHEDEPKLSSSEMRWLKNHKVNGRS